MTGGKTFQFDRLLTYRVHSLSKLSARHMGEQFQARIGLTLPEARVVLAVGSFGPFSIMSLARRANLDKSQASRAADALIQQGLLQRETSEEDGRVVLVSLTTAGRAFYRKLGPMSLKWNETLMSCLTEAERTAFDRALDKVLAHALTLTE